MIRPVITLCLFCCFTCTLQAQQTFHKNGVADPREKFYALTHATIFTDYQTAVNDATLLIRDGKVVAVGSGIAIPQGAAVIDLQGKFIYPSFIDLYSDYGIEKPKQQEQQGNRPPQYESSKSGAYNWNQAVHPEVHANELFRDQAEDAAQLRGLGFGTVNTHQQDGIIRGTGTLVMLGDEKEVKNVLRDYSAEYYSFNKGISTQEYPNSLMGSIALIRQTYYDAQWYKQGGDKEQYNMSLDQLNRALALPQIFEVGDVYSALRADKIGDEFNIRYIIKGDGDEYQRLDDVKAAGDAFILPVSFPAAFDFTDPYDAQLVPLSAMMHWEMAPANAAMLEKAGITIALTAAGLKDKKDFLNNVRKAIDYGLDEKAALKALTYTPASLLGVADRLGSLAAGKLANFIVCSDSIFNEDNVMFQNWVDGIPYVINDFDFTDVRGHYAMNAGGTGFALSIEGSLGQPEATVMLNDSAKLKASLSLTGKLVTLSFHYPADSSNTAYLLSGHLDGKNLTGTGQDIHGTWIKWNATFTSPYAAKTIKKKPHPVIESKVLYPFTGFGNTELPKPETFLFRNATVWTNEAEGILQNTDVLISNGKIQQVGKNITAPAGAHVVDATGKVLTSGIIDEHSHIAIAQGVNECSHAVTSEVRIGDVLDPTDVSIYRNLSGGVTCSQLLHGSCNPVGGQAQLVKLRWGYAPEAMKFAGAPGFIKFALGENVKQSNFGDLYTIRFPQTRMGVEQVYYDAFIRAREYEKQWDAYNALKPKEKLKVMPPRRDLQLDALAEILDGKRFITCHSYVQSEITMLMHVADSMHFKMNTFTHVLEGYKIADKLKAHGVFASTFSDWWDYKFEVYDAIPYNDAILTKEGVITAVNSDDAEMARRLNQEAAKSEKYGGLSEEEAWKLCTLNPAKMLHVDDRVGSIKVGKDADVVLWDADPLSIYARCEMTLVDGTLFYDEKEMEAKTAWINKARTRLINEMMQSKAEGAITRKPATEFGMEWNCDTMTDGSGTH